MPSDTSNTPQGRSYDWNNFGYCHRCESRTLSLSDRLCLPCQETVLPMFGPKVDCNASIPYPNLTNPKTGQPFTESEINAIHRLVADQMEAFAQELTEEETGCPPPAFRSISLKTREAARWCLDNALNVASANKEFTSSEVA